jgi:hypothetical protein
LFTNLSHYSRKYEQKYVGFLDILGFSPLVMESASDQALFDRLEGALDMIDVVLVGKGSHSSAMSILASDSILISDKCDLPGLWNVTAGLEYASTLLLEEFGLMSRGALAKGLCLHNERLCFGPSIVQAVELEKHVAIYPRVILTTDLVSDMTAMLSRDDIGNIPDHLRKRILKSDTDGRFYIDPFGKFGALNEPDDPNSMPMYRRSRILETAEAVRLNLLTLLDRAKGEEKHLNKVNWLVDKFNAAVSQSQVEQIQAIAPT